MPQPTPPPFYLQGAQHGENIFSDIGDGFKKAYNWTRGAADTANKFIDNQVRHNRLISKVTGLASMIPGPYSVPLKAAAALSGAVGLGKKKKKRSGAKKHRRQAGGCKCTGQGGAGANPLARSAAVKW